MPKALFHKRYIRANERVFHIVHVSWLHYRYRLLAHALVISIAFFFLYPLQSFGMWGMAVFAALLIVAFLGLLRVWILRMLNVFIITNKRIIDIDQRSLFHRTVSECTLANIHDVRYNIKGVVSTLFRVGTVAIYMDAATGHIELQDIHDPAAIKEFVQEAARKHGNMSDTTNMATREEI